MNLHNWVTWLGTSPRTTSSGVDSSTLRSSWAQGESLHSSWAQGESLHYHHAHSIRAPQSALL